MLFWVEIYLLTVLLSMFLLIQLVRAIDRVPPERFESGDWWLIIVSSIIVPIGVMVIIAMIFTLLKDELLKERSFGRE